MSSSRPHRDERASAVTSSRGASDPDNGLDRLRRQYPRWRLWRGHTTGGYWALPPRDHPTMRRLVSARTLDELAQRLAQAQGRHDR
jgi:hypothetical protein